LPLLASKVDVGPGGWFELAPGDDFGLGQATVLVFFGWLEKCPTNERRFRAVWRDGREATLAELVAEAETNPGSERLGLIRIVPPPPR
jgi:hypothetical protein